MKKNRIILAATTFFVAGMMLISLNLNAQERQAKPWPVPEEFKNMENPVAADAASIKTGGVMYTKYCASCHGKTGLGDGVKTRALKDFAGDFSGAYYQDQTDGEHFYKTKVGRGEMPKYEGRMSDEDIWHVVNYMRTFKK
ncbi:MAG: cytochrome c [Bacteroidales bacterium]|jgi:mono/diheme cytochrome c family protein|nr:cytochrome c [Bacteroidales bacterium]